MNSVWCRAVLVALLALCSCTAIAGEYKPGPHPAVPLFDPAGILDDAARAEISRPLEKTGKDVDVIAVVLTNRDIASPEAAAAGIATAWCVAPLHAVVLHIPGRDGSPWIVAGGDIVEDMNPDELRDELAAARRDASREPDDASKVRTAATATADLLRFWQGREATRLGMIEKIRINIRRELETHAHRQQAIMLAVVIALIAGVAIAIRLLGKSRRVSADKP
jgi:hypothetical protein